MNTHDYAVQYILAEIQTHFASTVSEDAFQSAMRIPFLNNKKMFIVLEYAL